MSDLKSQSQASTQTQEQSSLLEDILSEANIKPNVEGYDTVVKGVQHLISEMLAPGRKDERVDKNIVDAMIAEIDARLSAQVNEILHHPDFQKLESAWRSLRYAVDQVDFRENIKIEMLNVSKEDLINDFEDSPEVVKSGLYKTVYSNEYGVFGGKPIGLIVGNYEFGPGPQDVALL